MLDILVEEGYIAGYEEIEKELQNSLKVTLKYGEKGERVITGLKRISKPGLRVYAKRRTSQSFERFGNCHCVHKQGHNDGQEGSQP